MITTEPRMNLSEFTPVQRRMLEVLADGRPHTPLELHACLVDELGPVSNIKFHLTTIRKKLRPRGEDIICEIHNRKMHYRHVRLISNS